MKAEAMQDDFESSGIFVSFLYILVKKLIHFFKTEMMSEDQELIKKLIAAQKEQGDNLPLGQTSTPTALPEKELTKNEKELEQKMIKVIENMPAQVKARFKILHMLSDQRSKINDMFEDEVKILSAKMEEKKRPILEKRDNILKGETALIADMVPQYDKRVPELETIISGIQKTDDEKAEDEEDEKEHEPVNVDHLKEVAGVPDFWQKAIEGHPMLA